MAFATAILLCLLLQTKPADPGSEGMKALEEQRWDAAVAAFTKAIEADPKDYAAHFHFGLANSMLNKDAEAISAYRKVLELKPGLVEAQMNLAVLLLRGNQPAEAASLLTAVREKKPKDFRSAYYAGAAYLAAGKPADAEAQFKAALEIDPKSGDAALGQARAIAKQGRLDEAAPHFIAAGALLELAGLYEDAKQPEKAIPLYEKVPDDPAARERVGQLYLESGKAEEAIPHLEAAAAKSPTSANRYALALAYNAVKQFDKAEPVLAQVLAAEPDNLDVRMTFARVLRQQKKYGPAAQEFLLVAQKKPDSAEAWSDLAGMLILLEQYQPALGALDKVRALGAEKAAHHYFRAIVLDKHAMHEPALASYEKFLAMSEGKNPDEEFKARQRIRIIRKELEKR
jgi:tetratricopeptide (TPR) repeat protein